MASVDIKSNFFHSQYGIRTSLIPNRSANASNLPSARSYSSSSIFMGLQRLDQNNLDKIDPFITGFAFFVWTKGPYFIEAEIWKNFKFLTERNFKSFDGIEDMSLNTDNMQAGFAGNELPIPTNLTRGNTAFTLTHYELAGSPIREGYQYWITGIRDPETGLAHYQGVINKETGAGGERMIYSLRNHSAEAIYIVTDPSGASVYEGQGCYPGAIEFAAYFTNVVPTKVPMGHLNYSSGDQGMQEISAEFVGTFHQSKAVNELAVKILDNYIITQHAGDYDFIEHEPSDIANGYAPVGAGA